MICSPKPCVYCSKKYHKSIDCKTITKVEDRKNILCEKMLCFNCTGVKHRAAGCPSKRTCQTCKGNHHSLLCKQSSTVMVPTDGSVIYLVVVAKVSNISCKLLLVTETGSSYASLALLEKLSSQLGKKLNGLK